MKEKEESKLEDLKRAYGALKEKHGLASFEELNKDFNIEKAAETETDILVREIRKYVGDKIFNYMRFIESLLNPVNALMFTLSLVKLLNAEERKKLEDIYKEMMKSEVAFIKLDLEFSEEKEAQFIKDSCEFWKKIKTDLLEILGKIDSRWDDEKIEINNKGYFG